MENLPKFILVCEKQAAGIPAIAIQQILESSGYSAEEINNGNCDDFAFSLFEIVGGEIWGTNWEYPEYVPMHMFLKHNGRYYDAETPDGVNDPEELPIFQRK